MIVRVTTALLGMMLLAVSGLLSAPASAGEPPPFSASVEALTLSPSASGVVSLTIAVPAGSVIYREQVAITVLDPGGLVVGEASLPPAITKLDPYMNVERELYDLDVIVEVPVTAPAAAGEHELLLEARWQGCKTGICFLPQTELLAARVTVAERQGYALPGLLGLLVSEARAEKLSTDNPVGVEVAVVEDGLKVDFRQLKGWHMTQSMTFIEVAADQPVALGDHCWPEAHQRPDPAMPEMTRGEYDGNFTVMAMIHGPEGEQTVKGTVGYQACKAEKCLLPQYHDFELKVPLTKTSEAPEALNASCPAHEDGGDHAAAAGADGGSEDEEPIAIAEGSVLPDSAGGLNQEVSALDVAADKGLIWLILFVMGAGFLVSLTPCVLPMIPITMGIIGAASSGNRLQSFLLSLTYVAGLAMVYTGLGVFAAVSGSLFGGWMQSPWVVGAVAVFFAIMGVSMFGFFDVAVPSSIATKLNQKGGAGFGGAFIVGMVGGVVAGPCSGPVIASLMVMIGQQGEIAMGAALMLAFSLGMGILFIIAGTFSSLMLQPGMWMDTVKKFFGVLLWLGAIYYASPHLPETAVALLTAFVLLSTAVFGWPKPDGAQMEGDTITGMKRLYGVTGGLVGGYLLVGTLATSGFILPPLQLGGGAAAAVESGPEWRSDEAASLAYAQENNLPVIIDFTADWCAACKELEHFTYTDPRVIAQSKKFVPVMIDATKDTDPEVAALLKKYKVNGLPTVKFLQPDGSPMNDLTLTGFIPADEFLPLMDAALERTQ